MCTSELLTNCGGVVCIRWATHPGGEEILLVTSCYRNQDKLLQLWTSIGSKASLYYNFLYQKSKNPSQNSTLWTSQKQHTHSNLYHFIAHCFCLATGYEHISIWKYRYFTLFASPSTGNKIKLNFQQKPWSISNSAW